MPEDKANSITINLEHLPPQDLTVVFPDGREYPGRVEGTTLHVDISPGVLTIEMPDE